MDDQATIREFFADRTAAMRTGDAATRAIAGVVLTRGGGVQPMPGLPDDRLFGSGAAAPVRQVRGRHPGALLLAAAQWPIQGVPANPTGWLITVATRRLIEIWRNEAARRRREHTASTGISAPDAAQSAATHGEDDSLKLLFLCCDPALTLVSQVALTLRAVGGLTTAEIAGGLLVPESTVAQRITRAKTRIRDSGASFTCPTTRSDRPGWPPSCTCSTWCSTRATPPPPVPTCIGWSSPVRPSG